MIKKLVVIIFLIGVVQSSCSCNQMTTYQQCVSLASQHCAWNLTQNKCDRGVSPTTTPQNLMTQLYCSTYKNDSECLNKYCPTCEVKYPCAWILNQCTIFPGCTAFEGSSMTDCQKISKNCVSDGTWCVDLNDCKNYQNQTSCSLNRQQQLCYWQNSCDDVTLCSQLPKTYITHSTCQSSGLKCTTQASGGCMDLQQSCENYTSKESCNITLTNTNCVWSNNKCMDKSCLTATTNDDCSTYLGFNKCVKSSAGGCDDYKQCKDFLDSTSCVRDSSGNECIFAESTCLNKACSNAPQKYYQDCSKFLPNCISNNGLECIENLTCTVFTSEDTCKVSKEGKNCYWDTVQLQCINKTCSLAKQTLTKHSECEAFLPSCTVDFDQSGCQQKSCDNAPTELITNSACEKYLPGAHCVTRSGGGCITNGECSKLSVEAACVQDINGNPCYWNPEEQKCGTKVCSRASKSFKTQEQCQQFLQSCQLNSQGEGCEEKSCENIRDQNLCSISECLWQTVCQVKTCKQASSAYTLHSDCQDFMSTCTVSNSGLGCMELPLQCSFIKSQEGCKIRKAISYDGSVKKRNCIWKTATKTCEEYSCESVIPDVPITNEGCKKFREYDNGPYCYINNTENGCGKLPPLCSNRGKKNCDVDLLDCVWSNSKNACLERTCNNAQLGEYSLTSCLAYNLLSKYCDKDQGLGCCTVNNDSTGCTQKKLSCQEYSSDKNCQLNALMNNKSCLFKDGVCIDYSCSGLPLINLKYSHANCQGLNEMCTVNKTLDGCDNVQNSCLQYKIFEQCVVDNKGNSCIWSQQTQSCDLKGCNITQITDDPQYGTLNNYTSCQKYQSSCTVIQQTGGLGCVPRLEKCSYYQVQSQCHKTNDNFTDQDNCVWDTKRCWNKSEVDCKFIVFDSTKTYTTQNCESISFKCKANDEQTSCVFKYCQDFTTKTGLTGGATITQYSDCQALSQSYQKCSIQFVDSKYKCVEAKSKCSDYGNQESCIYALDDKICKWNGKCFPILSSCTNFDGKTTPECQAFRSFCIYDDTTKQCVNGSCTLRTQQGGETLTHDLCQQFDPSCTFYTGDTMCSQIPSSCKNLLQKQCTYMRENEQLKNCIYYQDSSPQCVNVESSTDLVDYCQSVTLNSYTFDTCQKYSKSCSVNRDQSKCVLIKQICTQYTKLAYCYKDSTGYCIQTAVDDIENVTKCKQYSTSDGCSKIFLGKSTSYTHELCNRIDKTCTNDTTKGCTPITCNNYSGSFSHQNCNTWYSKCTVNLQSNGCVEMVNLCSDFTKKEECNFYYTAKEGYCIFNDNLNICKKKTCYNSKDQFTSDNQCNNFMNTCTVSLFGGCTQRKSCYLYETKLQCQFDQNSNLCFWNPTFEKCVDFTCDNIEQTELFSTHKQCFELDNIENPNSFSVQNRCTVKGFAPELKKYGCSQLKSCSEYLTEQQCVIDKNQRFCTWNADNKCVEITCATAGEQYLTHQSCQQFKFYQYDMPNNQCTVAATVDEQGNPTFQGCMDVRKCEEYPYQQQCNVGVTGTKCKWIEETKQCLTYNCESAPLIYNTHEQCENYLYSCTINYYPGNDFQQSGCINKKLNCADYTEPQCHSLLKHNNDQQEIFCVWKNGQCVERKCDNAPMETSNCQAFLSQCIAVTELGAKCRKQSCENYYYSTDAQCKAAGLNSLCTTNGIRCVLRTTCEEAQVEEACKVNNRNQFCIWAKATNSNDAYCKTSECDLAPTTIMKFTLCQNYKSYCTVKLSGGCKIQSDCGSFEEQESCLNQLSRDGKKCRWKNEKCGQYDCSDIKSNDHFVCSKYKSECTTSQAGLCVVQYATCDQYTFKNQCVQTLNNVPCIWLTQVVQGTKKESCVQFTKCSDAMFSDHASCYSISPYCTTNGVNCIPIGLCSSYSEVSCHVGVDGNCIYSYPSATADAKQCILFTECNEIQKQITHQGCQQVNSQCTSDGSVGCIYLKNNCKDYNLQVPCVVTNQGKYCKWNENVCQDEQCEQIDGANPTHEYCNQRSKTCTSDGNNCITQLSCSSYLAQLTCTTAYDTSNRPCVWDNVKCRNMICEDFISPFESTCASLSNCIFDGIKCVNREESCSRYTTQIACSYGTSESLCIWNLNRCSQPVACQELNSNQQACENKVGCVFQSLNGSDQCVPKSCQTIYEATGICTFFADTSKKLNYCSLSQNQCRTVDPATFTPNECLVQSNYTFSWNSFTSKCQDCNFIGNTNTTNSTNSTNSSNQTSSSNYWTSFSFILNISLAIIGMFW